MMRTGAHSAAAFGRYGGGDCASTNHSHHHGLEDSVYRQTQLQNAFYAQVGSGLCKRRRQSGMVEVVLVWHADARAERVRQPA